ncbi:MAG: Hsp20/alpha crystallin family protein, partial [Rhizobiales bacterium]|nr:Hsp20/alpha crystallin family protein [Hyphomicrobiales bacterium]
VDEKDLDVTLTGDVLAIKGQKKQENESKDGDRRYVERSFGSFTRSVRLPFEASDQNVEADMKNGVLTVRIPKPADYSNRSKRIEIKAA